MCGIAGFTGRCNPSLLAEFQRTLHHRGPDDRGTLCDAEVGLANNRLSVIDLPGGQQPIFNEDRSCAIVFNGEIYNYRELRRDLLPRHQFRTESDTEVILHLYEEKGLQTAEQLKGDFAFCIWDSRQKLCYLSRDPLGVKPLFYALSQPGNLVFSSEMACLLLHPEINPELDLAAVAEYLTCLYIAAPRSLIGGVRKLCPGESLLWKEGSLKTWRYWSLPAVEAISPGDFKSRAHELLRTAVARRLIADVPVGAFLSGGLDSGLVVALASQEVRGLQTFSVGFGEPDFDELRSAREVSRRYGTDHHEIVLRPEAPRLLEEVIAVMDEPIADSSAIPTFLVARETRQFVKVALSGVGGDELFFGYPRYLGAKLSQRLPAMTASTLRFLSSLFSSRPSGRDVSGWIRRFGHGLPMDPWTRYWFWTTFLDKDARRALFAVQPADADSFVEQSADLFRQADGDYLDKIFRVDVVRYLGSDLLKFGDTMTMANSLELRVPFCDVDLVGEAARAPASVRLPGFRLKSVLREIAREYLPSEIINRRKQGFMIPIGRWFRHELKDYLRQELNGNGLPAFLNAATVRQLTEEHISGQKNHTHLLWALLVLTRWLQLHPAVQPPRAQRTP